MIHPNVPFSCDEYAVEWTWPDGTFGYSEAEHTAELASEHLGSKPPEVSGRVVRRTLTVTAWEVP